MSIGFLVRAAMGLAAIVAAAAAGPSSARAEVYVIESTAGAIRAGSRLAPGDAIDIPAGTHIRAVLPSGKTQTFKGPYKGPVSDLAKGQTLNEGVMSWLKNILQTGGSTEATPGAVRSIARARPPASFSWSAVPVVLEGSMCVEKGAQLQLVRAASPRPERVTVADVAGAQQGEAQWEPGAESAAWPAGVTVRTGAAYRILVPDRPQRTITLHVLERLPGDDDVLNELHRLGCRYQFEAWVREKLAKK